MRYCLFISTLVIACGLVITIKRDQIFLVEWRLSSINSSSICIPLVVDKTSCAVRITVLLISSCVLWFTSSYIRQDVNLVRFTLVVMSFVLAINCLVFIPNLITLLLGWDGLGVTSFILVIYYQNPKSLGAGIITALSNRIGDALLITSIALLIREGDWNIFSLPQNSLSGVVGAAIVAAAITKRAQMPFSSWLPAAMAAPTPVSALVHSSTLVTAGVFLLIRFYPTLASNDWFGMRILIIGLITRFIAGTVACLETDLKKIIALSTLRQLGLIILRLGLGLRSFALFHLLTHALFKALLFLCAGTIIHYQQNNQDIRLIGNLSAQLPFTTSILNMANLALCGFPFLAGFYSKDLILERISNGPSRIIFIMITWLRIGLTTLYSVRLSIILIWRPSKRVPLRNIHEEEKDLLYPIVVLRLGAIIGGALFRWVLNPTLNVENLPLLTKTLPLILLGVSFYVGRVIANPSSLFCIKIPSVIYHAISNIWFLTPLSSTPIIRKSMKFAKRVQQFRERGWQEILGGQGALFATTTLTKIAQQGQKNPVRVMLLLVGISVILVRIAFYCYSLIQSVALKMLR